MTHAQSIEEEKAPADRCAQGYSRTKHDDSRCMLTMELPMEAGVLLSGMMGYSRLVSPLSMNAYGPCMVTKLCLVKSRSLDVTG
ncbi:hypothetical protein TNCV_1053911 [Trichonephila clavipes]|nr:hypothetical protein TNCV_1053911 [Trichonephila clavipes]